MAKAKKENIVEIKKGRTQFDLIGKVKINDYTFKMDNDYASGWVDNILNVGIDCGNGNTVYADMRSGYFPKGNKNIIYVHGNKEDDKGNKTEDYQNRMEIDWDDREDETILETIAKSCFISVGIETDTKGKIFTKKFITPYDAIVYLQEHLKQDMVVNVRGKLEYKSYLGDTQINKTITSIYLSKVAETDFKAAFTQTILYDAESLGKKDIEKNTINFNAYVVDYVGNVKVDNEKVVVRKNIAFPINFEIKISDVESATAKFIKRYLTAKKDKVNEITVCGNIIEGSNVVTINDEDIPDDIKELIDMGLYTKEEAMDKCVVGGGKRTKRFIIEKPDIMLVGEGDTKKSTVAMTVDKFEPKHLISYDSALESLGVNTETSTTETKEQTESEIDDELEAMLNDL